jgi:hypothetical protein
MEQKEHKVEFFISNIEGKSSAEIIDLNKIFEMNFSYNFDLLKNLIEALMKNQKNFQEELKEKTLKINDLENQILALTSQENKEISINKTIKQSISQPIVTSREVLSSKLISLINNAKNIIKEPPNEIKLDESSDEKTNKIVVSIIFNIYYIYLEKNKWNE